MQALQSFIPILVRKGCHSCLLLKDKGRVGGVVRKNEHL